MLSKMQARKEAERKLKCTLAQDIEDEGFKMSSIGGPHLACGSYGVVYKCTRDRKDYAVKVVSSNMDMLVKNYCPPNWNLSKNTAQREQKYLEKIGTHRNVIQLEAMFYRKHELTLRDNTLFTVKNFYFVMEFADSKSLENLINTQGRLSENMAKFLARDLLSAVAHLHSKGVAHLDVKPGNCLLCKTNENPKCEFVLKLADFNLSSSRQYVIGDIGTLQTMCPEFLRFVFLKEKNLNLGKPASTIKADYWSLGATIYFMFHAQYPLVNSSSLDFMNRLMNQIFLDPIGQVEYDSSVYYRLVTAKILPPYNPTLTVFSVNMLSDLLQVDPVKRCLPRSEMVRNWINKIDPIPIELKIKSEDGFIGDEDKLKLTEAPKCLNFVPSSNDFEISEIEIEHSIEINKSEVSFYIGSKVDLPKVKNETDFTVDLLFEKSNKDKVLSGSIGTSSSKLGKNQILPNEARILDLSKVPLNNAPQTPLVVVNKSFNCCAIQ